MGGGGKYDGFVFYFLQWMLVESQKYYFVFEYNLVKWIVDRIFVEYFLELVLFGVIDEIGLSLFYIYFSSSIDQYDVDSIVINES